MTYRAAEPINMIFPPLYKKGKERTVRIPARTLLEGNLRADGFFYFRYNRVSCRVPEKLVEPVPGTGAVGSILEVTRTNAGLITITMPAGQFEFPDNGNLEWLAVGVRVEVDFQACTITMLQ